MNVLIDTRERKYDHITDYFDDNNIGYYRSKLVCGDYQNPLNPTVIIDRKKDLQEVAGNVTKDHERFVRELELANKLGYTMIVLVEESGIETLEDVRKWYNWRRRKNPKAITGKTLCKIMMTMQEKYNFTWMFCDKSETGCRIVELLEG